MDMSETRILRGDGGTSCPYVVRDVGGEKIESPTLETILEKCDTESKTQKMETINQRKQKLKAYVDSAFND